MTSGFSVDEAKKDIYQIGFHVIENPALGSAFEQMTKDEAAFDISSDTGFEFCLKFVLSEPRVKETLDALGDDLGSRFILGYCGGIPADPNRIYSFRAGGDKPHLLLVHAWPRNSSSVYYCGLHSEKVPKYTSDNNLLRVLGPDAKSFTGKELGYDGNDQRHPLADGGLVIWDARAAFRSLRQWSYFYVFVEEEQLKEWKETREFWKKGLRIPASQDPDYVAQLGVYVQRDQAS
ncbi:hypothetical protein FANTH_9522 [Fusarium anthophilum]|uniref:Uncharacterized protein n=1 Tax=Fusarium anthophilum TaxID=48485 RepID=A0A8H4Z5R8_9HYPO|nr:hypothetical protein FANTH_9522 [Fusarium anthophilum]